MDNTIFVVDNNEVNGIILEEMLMDQYKVIFLHSAEKMYKALEKVVPNLIILDIGMPVIDGFEALQWLKESGDYADIPVICVSYRDDAESEIKCFDLGAIDYINRPFDRGVVRCRVKARIK